MNNNLTLTYSSFYITYVFLITTATITFIEGFFWAMTDIVGPPT